MKFGVVIEPNSACFSLLLGDYSFFSFGVNNVLVSRFVSPFKCTVDKKLYNYAHNSLLEGATQLKQVPLVLSFRSL